MHNCEMTEAENAQASRAAVSNALRGRERRGLANDRAPFPLFDDFDKILGFS